MYLIDTNVLSEVRKLASGRCHANVARWWRALDGEELFLSVLVLGELHQGIERLRARDPVQATALETWLGHVVVQFAGRILAVDQRVAEAWGRMSAARSLATVDALLAATAQVHGLTLVTRNLADVAGCGVRVLDPFSAES